MQNLSQFDLVNLRLSSLVKLEKFDHLSYQEGPLREPYPESHETYVFAFETQFSIRNFIRTKFALPDGKAIPNSKAIPDNIEGFADSEGFAGSDGFADNEVFADSDAFADSEGFAGS